MLRISKRINQWIDYDLSSIFLFVYGLIIQIVSFPVIYYYSWLFREKVSEALIETLVRIWLSIPILALFSIIIAAIQIKRRKQEGKTLRIQFIGLTLNISWIICYCIFIDVIFEGFN